MHHSTSASEQPKWSCAENKCGGGLSDIGGDFCVSTVAILEALCDNALYKLTLTLW